jgi:hypothetical protein
MLKLQLLLLLFVGCLGGCLGKVFDSVSDLPGLEYDFVIIGGTDASLAGGVLFNWMLFSS